MWNGKMKALTFSYDDGNMADGRLIEILDRYGMKGTFNINTAKLPKEGEPGPLSARRGDDREVYVE